ncbi:MAG: menaquinol oxidoreductase [Gammaproteobacteria bacterium]|nr:MAG: menaquinol oxidoreductase [Chloroflexota bacterium]TDJ37783.1 MAG: menaquinol oxidoreductase [Gammaproteobacteria bacterium]
MNVSIVPGLRALRPAALVGGTLFLGLLVGYWANATWYPGTSPEQPIEFSHRIHAGENEIPCMYCHTQARRSISAGVPSVSKCVGCHKEIATERPQIRKLMSYWQNEEPIPWIKVHDLPDFVHFTHKRHVSAYARAAGIECQTCHGPVETMDRIRVTSRAIDGSFQLDTPWEMGLCLNCHRQHQVEHGTDCWTCHK